MNLKDYRKFSFQPTEDITVYELALISKVPSALTGLIREGMIPRGCRRHFQVAGQVYEERITVDNQDQK